MPAPRTPGKLEALRGFGVMLGGSAALVAVAAAGVFSSIRSLIRFRRPNPLALAITALTTIYLGLVRPRHLRWGSLPGDLEKEFPGQGVLPESGAEIIHAITIDAPADQVWPWVAQLGQDRGGFYSYEWLENLAGCAMRNADRIHPEWQAREVGETVFLHKAGGLKVTVFEPGKVLGLEGWGNFIVEPVGTDQSRLYVRGRIPTGVIAAGYATLLEIPHFVMERRMLLGIKERAERNAPAG